MLRSEPPTSLLIGDRGEKEVATWRLVTDQVGAYRSSHGRGDVEHVHGTAAVDESGRLWVSFVRPLTYVYDGSGEKIRTVQFRAAGIIAPSSLSFSSDGRLLVTPGCYEFLPR